MNPLRGWRTAAACAAITLALPASASAGTNFDLFDEVSYTDNAFGVETAYTGGETFVKAVDYNSASFGLEPGELAPNDHRACASPDQPGKYDGGGRSGWVRFLPASKGKLQVDVTTPGYDSIVNVWTSDNPRRFEVKPTMPAPSFQNVNCNSANRQAGGEKLRDLPVQPNQPLWIQTLGYCGTDVAHQACPNPATAPGGPTTVLISFKPDNLDEDAVPDTLDACPDQAGSHANGCLDRDGDGIADNVDPCVFCTPEVTPTPTPPAPTPTPTPPVPTPTPAPAPDTDRDGTPDKSDRCVRLYGERYRQGCPTGLLNDPSIDFRKRPAGVRVDDYFVKATKGARIVVKCSRGCRPSVAKGQGQKRVRIPSLRGRTLKRGTTITTTVSVSGKLVTTVVDRIGRGRRSEGTPTCTQPGTSAPRIGC